MIIVSNQILGNSFINVAFHYADKIASERNYDKKEITQILNNVKNLEEFKEKYEKYFGDEIKLKIKTENES